MPMAVVVWEALCVCAGGAWGTAGSQSSSGFEKCEVNTKENEVVAACLTRIIPIIVIVFILFFLPNSLQTHRSLPPTAFAKGPVLSRH